MQHSFIHQRQKMTTTNGLDDVIVSPEKMEEDEEVEPELILHLHPQDEAVVFPARLFSAFSEYLKCLVEDTRDHKIVIDLSSLMDDTVSREDRRRALSVVLDLIGVAPEAGAAVAWSWENESVLCHALALAVYLNIHNERITPLAKRIWSLACDLGWVADPAQINELMHPNLQAPWSKKARHLYNVLRHDEHHPSTLNATTPSADVNIRYLMCDCPHGFGEPGVPCREELLWLEGNRLDHDVLRAWLAARKEWNPADGVVLTDVETDARLHLLLHAQQYVHRHPDAELFLSAFDKRHRLMSCATTNASTREPLYEHVVVDASADVHGLRAVKATEVQVQRAPVLVDSASEFQDILCHRYPFMNDQRWWTRDGGWRWLVMGGAVTEALLRRPVPSGDLDLFLCCDPQLGPAPTDTTTTTNTVYNKFKQAIAIMATYCGRGVDEKSVSCAWGRSMVTISCSRWRLQLIHIGKLPVLVGDACHGLARRMSSFSPYDGALSLLEQPDLDYTRAVYDGESVYCKVECLRALQTGVVRQCGNFSRRAVQRVVKSCQKGFRWSSHALHHLRVAMDPACAPCRFLTHAVHCTPPMRLQDGVWTLPEWVDEPVMIDTTTSLSLSLNSWGVTSAPSRPVLTELSDRAIDSCPDQDFTIPFDWEWYNDHARARALNLSTTGLPGTAFVRQHALMQLESKPSMAESGGVWSMPRLEQAAWAAEDDDDSSETSLVKCRFVPTTRIIHPPSCTTWTCIPAEKNRAVYSARVVEMHRVEWR